MRDTIQTENIDIYMRDIEKFDRISIERENQLAAIIHGNNPEQREAAITELVQSNLKLVIKIAHDFKRYGVGFADLVAEGNVGLMIAADKFEPGKGSKFSGYAAWWIKQSMRNAVATQSRTIRVPAGTGQKLVKLEKAHARLKQELDREPTEQELEEATGVKLDTIEVLKHAAVKSYSLDMTVKADSETTFADMIATETHDERASVEQDELITDMHERMAQLPDFDRELITRRFNLDKAGASDKQIATELGIGTNAVDAYARRAIDKLRDLMSAKPFS